MRALRIGAMAAVLALAAPVQSHALEKINFLIAAPLALPAFGPLIMAEENGYYKDAGYEVEFHTARGGLDIAKQVGVGNAEFGLSLGDAPIVVRGNGIPIKVVATLGGGALGVFVARKDRNIEKIEDLRGKKISVMSFQEANFYAALGALEKVGIRKDDANIQAVGPAGVVGLVIAGAVDACICTPDWEVAVQDGVAQTVSIPLKDHTATTAQAIVASDEMIAKKPDMVRAIVQATLKGMKFIMDNPQAATKIYIRKVPSFEGRDDVVLRMFKNFIERAYKGQQVVGETDPKLLKQIQKSYMDLGLVNMEAPVETFYSNAFVK
ncbi:MULTISPECIES: ABC transporter substrate-binding protein [unclassified Beijerinckia]|uniref:ABC transporter substrate-binding protein n=1 Tax=unclassified Beijerinckia TaxID=2638183 RepID=UPI000896D807|nr:MULTISPECIES: ABC transporter substrate-binding protein [unclassified Beijerinckia]MDH7799463.1 NitT/TauT family transport system substrate-binding protein [Beijerinckia sp. GAS462]SED51320.1 NitT/TauT family transport system substrate-binding protein [Beijerinckia sp. 28-YEA-48]